MPEKKVILYESPSCPACDEFRPEFLKLAAQHGIRVETRNADICRRDDKFCQKLEFVPAVAYQGKEIPYGTIPQRIKKLGGKK